MAIYFMHYNFVRIQKTLKITPAMAANVTPKYWEMSDMVKVLEDWEGDEIDERLFQEGRKPRAYDGDLLHAL